MFAKFHENLSVVKRVDSVLKIENQQAQKLNQLFLVMSDLRETLQERLSDEYLQIYRRNFRHLLSK